MIEKPYRRYLLILVLLAGCVTGGRAAWDETVKLGCLPPTGTMPPGAWLNDCASPAIGDLAHSAVWFDLFPSIRTGIDSAKVLIFGDSRMQGAISQGGASGWFAARHIPFYLLAFSFGEQSGWGELLLKKYHPHPQLMIFDTPPYFTGGLSVVAQAIVADPATEAKAAQDVKAFLDDGPTYCRYLSVFCGRTAASYRSALDGHLLQVATDRFWFFRQPGDFPIGPPPASDPSPFEDYLIHARAMIQASGVDPRCIVFTIIPNSDVDASLAVYLAHRLGANAIVPEVRDMRTSDHLHLTAASSKIWASAFLADLEPLLHTCIP